MRKVKKSITLAEELEMRILACSTWDLSLLQELADMADMEDEWEAADGENFENVAFEMAEKIGIRIV